MLGGLGSLGESQGVHPVRGETEVKVILGLNFGGAEGVEDSVCSVAVAAFGRGGGAAVRSGAEVATFGAA